MVRIGLNSLSNMAKNFMLTNFKTEIIVLNTRRKALYYFFNWKKEGNFNLNRNYWFFLKKGNCLLVLRKKEDNCIFNIEQYPDLWNTIIY